jgi:hypothetical protein
MKTIFLLRCFIPIFLFVLCVQAQDPLINHPWPFVDEYSYNHVVSGIDTFGETSSLFEATAKSLWHVFRVDYFPINYKKTYQFYFLSYLSDTNPKSFSEGIKSEKNRKNLLNLIFYDLVGLSTPERDNLKDFTIACASIVTSKYY